MACKGGSKGKGSMMNDQKSGGGKANGSKKGGKKK